MWRPFLIFNLILICLLGAQGVYAQDEELPLVWVSATDLLYAGGETPDGYTDTFHLSYKYSSDWVLIAAKASTFNNDSITYQDGTQFAFTPDGKKLSELKFSRMDETLQYSTMERASLGPDGRILTPFTGANIGYAVIQAKGGTLEQIALAKDAEELKGNLHLYDGFLYQFDDNLSLKAQIAFSEISFSTQGLLRSSVEPPANTATAPPPATAANQTSITPYSENPIKPESGVTLFSTGNETLIISIPSDYDIPPIKNIGVVKFTEHANRPDLAIPATEQLARKMADIPDLEVKVMSYDDTVFGGGLLYERAVKLGAENSVDAFIISDLAGLKFPELGQIGPNVSEIRICCEMEFAVIDCTGGRVFWNTKAEHAEYVSVQDFKNNKERIITLVIGRTIDEGLKKLKKSNTLAGGHVGQVGQNEG